MKAVIATGGKQYIVEKGDELNIELVGDEKTLSFEPLMIINDKDSKVGNPSVKGAKVTAKVIEASVKGEKVTSIRYKSKKRVNKTRGARQQTSVIQITNITA